MVVATSNDKALLQRAFARLKIDGYFQEIMTCSYELAFWQMSWEMKQ